LNLIPHFNLISIDGVYAAKDGEAPVFYALRAPDTGDVADVAQRVAVRVAALLEKQDHDAEPEEPALATLYGASILGTQAMGHRAGQRVKTSRNARISCLTGPRRIMSDFTSGESGRCRPIQLPRNHRRTTWFPEQQAVSAGSDRS
jgi:hypothetical protein